MLYLFDKLGNRIGTIKPGMTSICLNVNGHQIGKIAQSGNHLYLYNISSKLLGRFNGSNTYDSNGNFLCYGNGLYNILYPTLKTIR